MTTLTDLHNLEERYPFNQEEMEILVRCHECLQKQDNVNDFLRTLAMASPYSYYFLPWDELSDRVAWLQESILPPDFARCLRDTIFSDEFVGLANQGQDPDLESFLEGIADTGRRGSRQALATLFDVTAHPTTAKNVIDHVVRIALAAEAIVQPAVNKSVVQQSLVNLEPAIVSMSASLVAACGKQALSPTLFVEWAEHYFPMMYTPLATLVHRLLFHRHAFPTTRIPYEMPKLDHASDIFNGDHSSLLLVLSLISLKLGGKWHRLHSNLSDGNSFNRLEWSLLGYSGPTIVVIQTTKNGTLGAFTTAIWKDTKRFFGDGESFLFQLAPHVAVHRSSGHGENFVYLHSDAPNMLSPQGDALSHGIGFGGTIERPRLFVPSSFEHCSADFADHTYQSGELVPITELEKFEIKCLEVWGVGGDDIVSQALRDRTDYRETTETTIMRSRSIVDKSPFVGDMQSGLLPNHLFAHQDQVRGRQEFRVDEQHGGYTLSEK